MASITKQISLPADADRTWAAVRDVANPHLLFAGVLTAAEPDGDDARVVTFADGLVVRERILAVDDATRCVAYRVEGLFEHHHATMTVAAAPGGSTLTWVTELRPDDAAPLVEGLMDQGLAAAAASLSRASWPARADRVR